ncbi:MAG: hypothetical protein KDC05_05715, partial [Bacteroidales bacterium]|nr:hypothetical protein [Bacteroidales bacterium]
YLVLVHFTGGRNNVFLQKEVMVATVYVTGVWGGPMVLAWKTLVAMDWLFAVIFLLLAFTNVLYFTVFDADSDTIDHHPTLLTRIGLRKTLRLFYALSLTTCLAACFSFFYTDLTLYKIASLIYILMDLMMVALIFYKKTTIVGVNYRYLGEMVFWLPGLLLLG